MGCSFLVYTSVIKFGIIGSVDIGRVDGFNICLIDLEDLKKYRVAISKKFVCVGWGEQIKPYDLSLIPNLTA